MWSMVGTITALVILIYAVGATGANADTLRVDCSEQTGRLKGVHGHFCDFGYTYYADKQKLAPVLRDIGASFLRVGVFNVICAQARVLRASGVSDVE